MARLLNVVLTLGPRTFTNVVRKDQEKTLEHKKKEAKTMGMETSKIVDANATNTKSRNQDREGGKCHGTWLAVSRQCHRALGI
jgi:hypothetical protein